MSKSCKFFYNWGSKPFGSALTDTNAEQAALIEAMQLSIDEQATIIQALTDTVNSADYIKKLKKRDELLKEVWSQITCLLSLDTEGTELEILKGLNIMSAKKYYTKQIGKNKHNCVNKYEVNPNLDY